MRRLVYNLMHFEDVHHADVWIFLFSFIKSTLSTKDCGIQGMRVAIMNILAEVTRKLILFCNLRGETCAPPLEQPIQDLAKI